MKTRLLLSLCLMFILSCQVYGQFTVKKSAAPTRTSAPTTRAGDNKIVYALCGNEVEDCASVAWDVEVKAYIRIPARQWKGCKITNVEIGLGYEAGRDSYVFISKDLEAEPIVKQDFQCDTIPESLELIGWKNVPLSTPYTIDSDDDLYIGLYGIQIGWDGIIGVDWGPSVEGGNKACFRRPGQTNWTYQDLPQNVSLKVTIEGESLPQNHLRFFSYSVDKLYYKMGEDISLSGSVINEGVLPVSSFDFTYQLNSNEAVTNNITGINLQPMQTYSFNYQIPIEQEGKGSITLTASNPNGQPDDFPETASTTISTFGCLAKGLQKNVLIEELIGTNDIEAPAATQIIKDAIDNCDRKENVIWIQNHVLSNDEYTIQGYKNYDRLFAGPIFTPAVNIDHKVGIPGTLMLDENRDEVPAETEMFIINNDFDTHLNTCLDREDVYFSLGLECEVVDDDVLKIKMIAKPALEGLFPPMVKPCIALLIVEDNIVGKQAGVEGDYIHNGVPRAFINDGDPDFAYIGDEVPFPSNGFTLETKYIIPDPSWKIENLRLIFYVMDGHMYIQNAVTCPVKTKTLPDGIKNPENTESEFAVHCNNGMLRIEGEFDKARIYTMDGQQIIVTNEKDTNVSKLAKGIYCVLIQKESRFVSKKFIIE